MPPHVRMPQTALPPPRHAADADAAPLLIVFAMIIFIHIVDYFRLIFRRAKRR
jgi:hypothetical protein